MKVFFVLYLLLAACQRNDPWVTEKIKIHDPQITFTKISLPTRDKVNGLDLEIYLTENKPRLFLNVHSFETAPSEKDPHFTPILLTTDKEEHTFLAYRLEGGQRLCFDEEKTRLFISALKDNKQIRIALDGFLAEVQPSKRILEALKNF